jgi:hypothetical protein
VTKLDSKIPLKPVQWAQVYPLLKDNISLHQLPFEVKKHFVRFSGQSLARFYTDARLYRWGDWILKDNTMLSEQGMIDLSNLELREAIFERGIVGNTDKPLALEQLQSYVEFNSKLKSITNRKGELSGLDKQAYCTVLIVNQMHTNLLIDN